MTIELVVILAGASAALLVLAAMLVRRWWHAVAPATALVVSRPQRPPTVALDGGVLAVPVLTRVEVIDLAAHPVVIQRRGKDGLSCRDGIRADLDATFVVRVNPTRDDVLRVATTVGCARAADPAALAQLFTARFADALASVARHLDFDELTRRRPEYRDEVLAALGRDLGGYVIDELALDRLEQTPLEQLDPTNVLDAQGIAKIQALTARSKRSG